MDAETNKQWSEMTRKDPNLLTWDEYIQHSYKNNKGVCCNCFNCYMFTSLVQMDVCICTDTSVIIKANHMSTTVNCLLIVFLYKC